MPAYNLRPALPDDAEQICQVHRAAVEGLARDHYTSQEIANWTGAVSPEKFRSGLAGGGLYALVAESQGQVVGIGIFSGQEIHAVYVRADWARRGVGAGLLGALEAEALRQGVGELSLDASLNAAAFYQAMGYETLQKDIFHFPNGGSMPCLRMRKKLP